MKIEIKIIDIKEFRKNIRRQIKNIDNEILFEKEQKKNRRTK
jgi:hypothetical protein